MPTDPPPSDRVREARAKPDRVPCPHCGRSGVNLTKRGTYVMHGLLPKRNGTNGWAGSCPGSGQTAPADPTPSARASLNAAITHYAAYPHDDNRVVVNECIDAYAEAIRAECAAEIAALKADRERLDWLEGELQNEASIDGLWVRSRATDTLRDAIDAVRASEPRGRA